MGDWTSELPIRDTVGFVYADKRANGHTLGEKFAAWDAWGFGQQGHN